MRTEDLKQISIQKLKGIGEKNGSLFARLGIDSVYDLLTYYPRDYKLLPKLSKVGELREGEICACKLCISDDFYFKKTANNAITTVTGFDGQGKVSLSFFRVTYLRNMLKPDSEWVVLGNVKRKGSKYAFEMPELYKPEDYISKLDNLQPVYPLTKGINSKTLLKFVLLALKEYGDFEETLPEEILKEFNFKSKYECLYDIHYPQNREICISARNRLVFEEFYDFFYGLNTLKKDLNKLESPFTMIETAEYERLREALPYELTSGQKSALDDIVKDLTSGLVMNRLIQGDVGSGKTIVAFLACLLAVSNGFQACFMAPTEVLASQHYKNFTELIKSYDLPVSLKYLSGSSTSSDKKKINEDLKSGKVNMVVGTHALFQENVEFVNLSLVVTDEQHRFGVEQRKMLISKGNNPHVLSLSATPIPRTLASVYYTDLQVSVIPDKPAQRIPVKTGIRKSEERVDGLRFIYRQVKEGHQAMIVCPMIEKNENFEVSNVLDYAEYLKDLMPKDIRVGILHGRMKNNEKNRVMEYFAAGMIDILVSTTVIEVGIDVPNATVIMIENAERFGLSTLHQLRGRVGRGSFASYCILIDGSSDDTEVERLKVLTNSDDGFYIADEDLRLRGPGDLLGTRQSGDFTFRLGDIYRDRDLFVSAKKFSDKLF